MENLMAYFGDVSLFSYLAAFASGLALSFTPCVYPLIPIVIAVIGSAGEVSRRRNFFLSLIYVAGMALAFSSLGVAAAATGMLFGELRTSPVVNLITGNIILIFALSVLGVINLPVLNLQKAGVGRTFRPRAIPVFAMGLVSGFIGAACVGPVLGAILLYIGTTGSIIFGFSLLFVFALGLGALLLAAGAFTGLLKSLAGASRAMHLMQKILAGGMILLAQYFIFTAGRYAAWF